MEVDGLPTVGEAAGLVTPDRLGILSELTLSESTLSSELTLFLLS